MGNNSTASEPSASSHHLVSQTDFSQSLGVTKYSSELRVRATHSRQRQLLSHRQLHRRVRSFSPLVPADDGYDRRSLCCNHKYSQVTRIHDGEQPMTQWKVCGHSVATPSEAPYRAGRRWTMRVYRLDDGCNCHILPFQSVLGVDHIISLTS